MHFKYPNLLSPLKVGAIVLKNRMTASPSRPHFIQGPEKFPSDGLISHYAKKAKNGASLVTCNAFSPMPMPDHSHDQVLDLYNGQCQHYIAQMVEAIHFYGSIASLFVVPEFPKGYDASSGVPSVAIAGDGSVSVTGEEAPAEMLDKIADEYARQALVAKKEMGFDMAFLHMAYRGMLPARFLSPLTNKRTDEFGGGLENRARFPLMICDRIKKACGEDFLIEAAISGVDPGPDGWTLDDTVRFAKLAEGRIDMLQLRASEIDPNHPTGFNPERTPFLYMAEAVKESGAKLAVVTIGGFQDLDHSENVIASGKADLIAMARSFICDPEYGRKAYEGRGEDIVPCIRCNKCHKSSIADPWVSVCSVNPVWGLEHRIEKMVAPSPKKLKIAVVGGGPAGMEAALTAAGRGHSVTLYEKNSSLGGQLNHTDVVSFKWPLRDFKDYLVRQINNSSVNVRLNTETTAEILNMGGYDVVLAAIGAEPIIPFIPGVDSEGVVYAVDVYGKEDSLARDVAVIGGGEVGVETGMYLAEMGHRVTLLEMQERLAPEATPVHYYSMFMDAVNGQKNLKCILNARCTGITGNKVAYSIDDNVWHEIKVGNVIIAVGMKSRVDAAMGLSSAGDSFYMIGDCNRVGNVQKAMRSAFSIASML